MPVQRQKAREPRWQRLYAAAAPQAGYLTLAQAAAAGYSSPLIEHHVKAGRLERVGRGIFRLVQFPPGDEEDLVVHWLWSRREGVFSHETALVLHQLSDALPGKAHMTVPASWSRRRVRIPGGLVLHHRDVEAGEVTWHGAIPLTTPLRTVVDMTEEGDPALAEQAARQAVRRRIFSRADLRGELAKRRGTGAGKR